MKFWVRDQNLLRVTENLEQTERIGLMLGSSGNDCAKNIRLKRSRAAAGYRFVGYLGTSPGASAEVVNGTYELTDHGKLIRHLTEEEYLRFTNYELRFFSSGWLKFDAASAAYFLDLQEVVTARVLRDTSGAMKRWQKASGQSWNCHTQHRGSSTPASQLPDASPHDAPLCVLLLSAVEAASLGENL